MESLVLSTTGELRWEGNGALKLNDGVGGRDDGGAKGEVG